MQDARVNRLSVYSLSALIEEIQLRAREIDATVKIMFIPASTSQGANRYNNYYSWDKECNDA